MPVLQLPGVALAYSVEGEGSPVTLLHGFTQRGDAWSELRQRIGVGHRWITVDLRGHGDTRAGANAPASMDACAEDAVALWDALDVRRSHLVGYSMGGRLALHVAAKRPERLRSLTVMSAHAGLGDTERAMRRAVDQDLAQDIETRGMEWFAGYWSSLPLFATLRTRRRDVAEQLHRMRVANDPASLVASLRGMGAGVMQPLWTELGRVACPSLVIAGADDARYVEFAERLGVMLPGARVAVVSGSGHAVHLEQPAIVAALIKEFLTGVDAETPAA
jgi:2-succinyl-6-hydroxy-2,4-cyclohexadiene-1-carboxylate synthase